MRREVLGASSAWIVCRKLRRCGANWRASHPARPVNSTAANSPVTVSPNVAGCLGSSTSMVMCGPTMANTPSLEEPKQPATFGDTVTGEFAAELLTGLAGCEARQFAPQRLNFRQTIQADDAPKTSRRILFQSLRAGNSQQRQQNVGYQCGPQAIEGRTDRTVNLAGNREHSAFGERRNRQQHSGSGKIVGTCKPGRGVFKQSQRGQKAIHRPV